MKKLFIITLILGLAQTVFATNSCLEDATDREILRELSHRLGSGEPGGGEILISSSCNSYMLNIVNTSLEKGTETTVSLNASTSSNCRSLSSNINQKLGSKALSRGVIIASCNSYMLNRVLASTNGELKQLEDKNLGTSSNCRTEARRLNSLW